MRKFLVVTMVMMTFVGALLVGCSSNKKDSKPASSSSSNTTSSTTTNNAATTKPAVPAGPQDVTLKVGERGQEYYFDIKQIALKTGDVKVTMINDGPDRPHNFVVRNLDGNGDLVASDRLTPGQQAVVSFKVEKAGTYNFLCTLPGHADRGAVGTLVVTNVPS